MSSSMQPVGRNAICPCGSGRRFKACCGNSALQPASAPGGPFADQLQRALALQQSGRLAEAELVYREVLEHEPELADAMHMLGVIHLQAGNYAEALRRLYRAAELFDWRFPAVRHNLGLAIAALLIGRNEAQIQRLWEAYDGWRDGLRSGRRNVHPCVSVIVASLDHADGLETVLESVFRQSYAAIELIVVDDRSVERLRPTLARSPYRWRVRASANRGAAGAINEAVAQSTGDFVNVLVSDDRFAATRVETMVDGIARAGATWGFSRAAFVGSDGLELPPDISPRASELVYIADDVAARDTVGMSFLSRNPAPPSPSALFFARSIFDKLGGFRELPTCYDWDFCLRASLVSEPVYVPSAEYEHRLRAGNGMLQPEAAGQAAEATFAAFYDAALATQAPTNPFAPVPAVWGERFFAQVLASGHAVSLPATVLRDLSVRVAATCGAASC